MSRGEDQKPVSCLQLRVFLCGVLLRMKSGRLDFQAPFDNGSEAEGALRNANTGKLGTS